MTALAPRAAPAVEPLSLAEVRAHLRLEGTDEDALLAGLLAAARATVERYLRRALIEQQWQLVLDQWPEGAVRLPRPPLMQVDAVRVLDSSGTATVVPAADYEVETRAEPGFLFPRMPGALPAPGRRMGGIEIDFTAGYGSDWNQVPAPVRHALLVMVSDLYETRGAAPPAIAGAVRSLLDPYRMMSL
ncbi:MAG: head-tail connector protein [Rhodothalassiaceae bacterium]